MKITTTNRIFYLFPVRTTDRSRTSSISILNLPLDIIRILGIILLVNILVLVSLVLVS